MQVYDEANALARAIRESDVCREYRQLKEEIDGIDNQILIEADYLVNANQSNYQPSAILTFRNTYFRTACGTRMLDLMYAEKLQEAEKNRTA